MRWITLVLLIPVVVLAQEIHSPLCLGGCPASAPSSNDLIIREIYILSSNDHTKFADWAAYRVTKKTIGHSETRTWKADPLLAEDETLEPKDYKDAHRRLKTDRGHQVPLASFTGTTYWKETNYLSNITPQKSALNQGPWQRLESAVRNLAKQDDVFAVYAMTGPLYEREMPELPKADESHTIPSGYWKIVAIEQEGKIQVTAFVFDQETSRATDYCTGSTTVDEVEARSGLNFFHALTPSDETQLESSTGKLFIRLGCDTSPGSSVPESS